MREGTSQLYREKVSRVRRFIEEHLDDDLSPPDLARVGHLSVFHFHRVFRGVTGESLAGHVRRLRLERAARRLRVTNARVTDLAFESGFSSHEAFTRAFHNHFGVPPSAYRDEHSTPQIEAVPPAQVSITWQAAIPVARVRRVGPYEGSGEAFGRLFGGLAQHGLRPAGLVLRVCLDDPDITPPELLRFDACVKLAAPLTTPLGELQPGLIPEGYYATATHEGSYDGLPAAYTSLVGGWAARTEEELADEACVEIYLNDPNEVPPTELQTEIRVRLLR